MWPWSVRFAISLFPAVGRCWLNLLYIAGTCDKMVASTERHALALSCWLAALVAVVSPSQELMKQLTTGFGKALNECKNELNIADHIMQDFMNYWREDYQLLNRDFGCAIMCMATKHDLVDLDGGIHHENAHAFTKKHGADDDQAKQLVTMIHDCHQSIVDRSDPCLAALEVAKCFKTKIHELKWAPSMEEIVAEVMSDVQPNPQ